MLLLLATPPLSLDHMQAPAQLHARRSRSYKREVPAGTPKAAPSRRSLPFHNAVAAELVHRHTASYVPPVCRLEALTPSRFRTAVQRNWTLGLETASKKVTFAAAKHPPQSAVTGFGGTRHHPLREWT